ncbi:MAG: hypothetical protein CL607_27355 [Anaerolineaceae bacterium]|nr:hypothetical protein [Anaerolineaceae bacterium]
MISANIVVDFIELAGRWSIGDRVVIGHDTYARFRCTDKVQQGLLDDGLHIEHGLAGIQHQPVGHRQRIGFDN